MKLCDKITSLGFRELYDESTFAHRSVMSLIHNTIITPLNIVNNNTHTMANRLINPNVSSSEFTY